MTEFQKNCIVCIIGVSREDKLLILRYERPRDMTDRALTDEALENFESYREMELQNLEQLAGVYIARSQGQLDYLYELYEMPVPG